MNNQYILPITIVVTGLIIAGAVFFVGKQGTPVDGTDTTPQASKIPPFTATDHILGNPDAPVKVVEYADLECPYCKTFGTTMHQIMDYYGTTGKVAWVFRHFPLTQIHSKAPKEAEAAECAAAQGGNKAFFNFIDKVFEVSPLENGLDLAQLPVIAGQVGLNVATFKTCLDSGTYAKKVQASYDEAIAAGGTGTPFSFVTLGSDAVPLAGAQPYDSMRAVIDAVLAQVGTGAATTTTQ